jgi:lipopolysaccharide transport system permease protein
MISNSSLIQKVYFPRLIVPATSAITGLIDLAISAVLLVGMMIHYGLVPHLIGILILPALLGCSVLSALGMGLLLASLNIKYQDVRFALPFFIQIMLYVTPVIYPVRMLDGYPLVKGLMLWLNPMSGVIHNARAGLLGQGAVDIGVLCISLLMSMAYFACGLYYFRSTERYFADIV